MSEDFEIEKDIRLLSAMDASVRQRAAQRLAGAGTVEAHFALHYRKLFERDHQTREVIRSSIERLEGRLAQHPTRSLTDRYHAIIAPILAAETPEPAARAAALSTQVFVEALSKLPSPKRASPHPLPPPQSLPELVAELRYPQAEWRRRVEGSLLLRGPEAIEPLRQAFAKATPIHKGRIAGVLAAIGDVEALPIVWVAWRSGMEGEARVSLKTALLRMGTELSYNSHSLPLAELLVILEESKEHLPGLAERIAAYLERQATENPTMELRNALPHLKGTWLHRATPALDRARRAIEAATAAWANLPIAASPAPDPIQENLPLPAEPGVSSLPTNLPRIDEASR